MAVLQPVNGMLCRTKIPRNLKANHNIACAYRVPEMLFSIKLRKQITTAGSAGNGCNVLFCNKLPEI